LIVLESPLEAVEQAASSTATEDANVGMPKMPNIISKKLVQPSHVRLDDIDWSELITSDY